MADKTQTSGNGNGSIFEKRRGPDGTLNMNFKANRAKGSKSDPVATGVWFNDKYPESIRAKFNELVQMVTEYTEETHAKGEKLPGAPMRISMRALSVPVTKAFLNDEQFNSASIWFNSKADAQALSDAAETPSAQEEPAEPDLTI